MTTELIDNELNDTGLNDNGYRRLREWVEGGKRTAKIELNSSAANSTRAVCIRATIWVFDYNSLTGTHIPVEQLNANSTPDAPDTSSTPNAVDISRLIEERCLEQERARYEQLKAKFE